MLNKRGHKQRIQTAKETPFDNSYNDLTSEDAEAAILEVYDTTQVSASPGFTWGSSGNTPTNTWLLNDTVPSNKAGRISPVTGNITDIFFAAENATTGNLGFYRNDGGGVYTLLTTLTVVASRKMHTSGLTVAISEDDEICVQVTSGSFKNPVVGLIIRGTSS